MASIPGTLLRAFTLLMLRIHGSVYIKRGRTGTCGGWTEHRSRSTTGVGRRGARASPMISDRGPCTYSPALSCLLTGTFGMNTGHCVRRVWVSSKGSNKVVNVLRKNDVILCTETVFFDIWAKLEKLTGDGWPFAIFYRKIIKNHYPSTRKHSSRMHTIYCHGHWEGGCVCPGGTCQGMSALGWVSSRREVCVSARGCLPRGCLPRGCMYVCIQAGQGRVCPSTCWDTQPPRRQNLLLFQTSMMSSVTTVRIHHQLRQSEYIISYDSQNTSSVTTVRIHHQLRQSSHSSLFF